MGKVQKVYTKEFKEEAVRLTQTSGKSIAQIARELGISDSAIHAWRRELVEHGKEAFPGKGHQTALEEENRCLKQELERVQQERDILKKVVSIFSRDHRWAYQFIEEHKHEFPIVVMCGVLAVSESGFYAWRKRPTCRRKREDAHLIQEIQQVFKTHQGRYGSPRIYRDLHDGGIKCSRKRVAKLMREEELSARSKRRRVITTKRDETHPIVPNLLNRDFQSEEPNKKWVTDITYIPTKQGWLYLAVILDLYSRMVVGLGVWVYVKQLR